MNKEKRLSIIKAVVDKGLFQSIDSFIEGCILDELMYAGLKTDLVKEFNKVLNEYSLDGYHPSQRITEYVKHYCKNPDIVAMQHVELNDCVSYFGEYYDGVPTIEYRKKGRYAIEPIEDKEQE